MKTAISLPDDLFEAADALAKELGVSRSKLYATAVAEYLARRRDEHITDLLDQVYSEQSSGATSGGPTWPIRAVRSQGLDDLCSSSRPTPSTVVDYARYWGWR